MIPGADTHSLRAPRVPLDFGDGPAPMALDDLEVTLGAVSELRPREMVAESAKMRAFSRAGAGHAAELAFEYGGRTDEVSRLASGEVREQVGLKLRAEDGCNLVYVVWRIHPVPEVVVQLKRNPGEHTHAQCGTDGYVLEKPAWRTAVPDLHPGDRHKLRAELRGESMTVFVDDRPVWRGEVPGSEQLHGTVGIRTDNAKVRFELRRLDVQ
jgi:hypothetical protein